METLKFWHFFEWFSLFFYCREILKVMILLKKVESFNLGCNKVSAVRNVTGSWLSNDTIVKMWSGFTLLLSIEERSWILKVEGDSIYPQLCQVCYQWSSSMLWKGMFIPPSSHLGCLAQPSDCDAYWCYMWGVCF